VVRAELLSVLALAAADRGSLPDILERSAPALSPRAAKKASVIASDLRAGASLGATLRRFRLVSRAQARSLDERADGRRQLRALADRAAEAPCGLLLVRWLPVWLMLATVFPGLLLIGLMRSLGAFPVDEHVRALGIWTPPLDWLTMPLWAIPLVALGLPAVIAALLVMLRNIALVRHLSHVWFTEIHRLHFAKRVLLAVGPDDDVEFEGNMLQVALDLLFVGIHRRRKPQWWSDWQAWYFLTRWRFAKTDRRAIRAADRLTDRLHLVGLLDDGPDAIPRAITTIDQQLRERLQASRSLIWGLLWMLAGISLTWGFMSTVLPIIEGISGGI
jgi:hypothetical protein